MILETSRLTLRPLTPDDVPAMHDLMSDAEVMAYWDVSAIEDPDLTEQIIASQMADMASGKALYWAMIRRGDGAFVGCCDLSKIDRWHHRAEVGFMAARLFWGEGYVQEAMQAVIHHAAQGLRIRRLSARAHLGNVRSTRLLERLGFAEEGLLRGFINRDGERRDCQVFGLLL